MLQDFFKNYLYPIAVMSGSIVGVGFLSLPYVTMKAGTFAMLFYFIILSALIVYLHVIFARVSLKTPDFKRFPGFVGYYLGSQLKWFASLLTVLGSFGVLLIYLIVAGEFLTAILSPVIGGSSIIYTLLFFVLVSLALCFGIKVFSKIEFLALLVLSALFVIIFIKGFPYIQLENIFIRNSKFGIKDSFLPYGAILFALWGTGLIPEVEEMVRGRKQSLEKIVVIATLIPAALYALFILFVLGITGSQTTQSALTGLSIFLNHGIITLGLGMGVVAIFMAFISQGMLLKKTFMYDLDTREFSAWALTCFVPLSLFLLGVNSFIPLVSFVGGVFLGINGILILLMYKKIGGKNIIIYPLVVFFVLGIIYELFYFLA